MLLWKWSYLINLESVQKLSFIECEVCKSGDNWSELIAAALED